MSETFYCPQQLYLRKIIKNIFKALLMKPQTTVKQVQ